MISLLLLLMTAIPIHSETLQIALPLRSSELIQSFGNSNFTQNTRMEPNRLICETEARDYQALARPFRIVPDPDFIETLSPALRTLTRQLLADRTNLGDYMASCSSYLRTQIRYQESSNSDDPDLILTEGRANCIGYCSLFTLFLKAAGIQSRISRGFYLSLGADSRVSLIPHRWLEITLDRDERIFFDPQYQSFRARYLKTHDEIQFTKIKKFSGRLLKQGRRLSNQEEP